MSKFKCQSSKKRETINFNSKFMRKINQKKKPDKIYI